jgi:hypothetical protein
MGDASRQHSHALRPFPQKVFFFADLHLHHVLEDDGPPLPLLIGVLDGKALDAEHFVIVLQFVSYLPAEGTVLLDEILREARDGLVGAFAEKETFFVSNCAFAFLFA